MSKLTGKRFVSMLLVIVMLFSTIPTGVLAEEVIEDPVVVISEESIAASVEEPVEEPSEEPAEEPAEEPSEEPAEEPAEELSEEPAEEPAEEPSEEPAEEPAEEPSEEPAEEPVEEPSEEPAEEPVEEPSEEPAEEPVEEPSEEPAEEPAEEPSEEPTEEEPTEEPEAEPTLYDQLAAEVDALLLKYLGEAFIDNEKTNAEILEDVNAMSKADIENAVAAMADGVFADLCDDIRAMEKAVKELNDAEAAAVLDRGVYAQLCAAAEERAVAEASAEEPAEEPSEEVTEEEPVEEPSEEVTEEEPVEEPSEEVTEEEPAEEPSEEVTEEEPAEEPSEEVTEEEPAEEPSEEVTEEEPAEEPSEEVTEEEPAEEPSEEVTEEEPAEEPSEEPTVDEPVVTIDSLRAEIAAYIEALGITPDMEDVYLLYAYGNHASYEEAKASLTKQDEFWEKGKLLTAEEQEILLAEPNTLLGLRYREVVSRAYDIAVQTEHNPLETVKVSYSNTNATSEMDSTGKITLTATASSSGSGCNTKYTATTVDVFVESATGEAGTIRFKCSYDGEDSFTIEGAELNSDGYYYSEGKTTITLKTKAESLKAHLYLSEFQFVPASQSFTINVEYPTAYGSVTSSVEGTSADVDGTTTMIVPEITAATGVTLTAVSDTFLCWVDKDNKFLSKDKAYTVKPSADTTVKAVMTGGNAYFIVNGNLYYGDLNEAIQMVATASNKTIVLANNGTLPAGDYTIPSGVTLLIPYNDANTLCTTAPQTTDASNPPAPKAYRTLTMEAGASITVNGALSLSATQASAGGKSSPTGDTSFINMQSGSFINVGNGGNLYVWGYITGSGQVNVAGGGTVYECFQVMDWRGGDNTSGMVGNSRRVFPFSQYYVQNVEVPMVLAPGAVEKGYMSVNISVIGIQGSAVPFIGDGGMFNVTGTNASIIKDYNEGTGRLEIDVYNGTLGINSLSITMKLGLLGSKTINSKDYVLPINGNITVTMHNSSINLTQDIALQPGAKLILDKDSSCTLGSGNKIYVYDYDEWTTEVAEGAVQEGPSFCGTPDATHINLKYPASAVNVSGRTDDASVEVNGTADLSAGYVYTTAGGANICGTVTGTGTIIMKPGTEKETYQVKNTGSDNKTDKWVAIPITSAKLKNADGTYVETAGNAGKVVYKFVDGMWTCQHTYAAGTFSEEVTTPATCLAAGVKTLTCNCGGDSKTEAIAQLSHDYESVVTEPTCTTAGYTTHTCKNGCGDSYIDGEKAELGHDEVAHEGKNPTCTEIGWDAYVTCNRCDYTTYVEKAELGHDEVSHEAKAPTCTEIGWDAYVTCNRCDYTTYVEKAALNHDEVPHEAKAPTCTEIGWDAYVTCTRCDYTTYVEKAKLGHDEVSHEAKAPTCTEIGWDAYVTCTRCDYTTYAEKAKLGHDEVSHEAKAPTCTEIGWDAYVTCTRCDYTTYVEKAELGHAWEWIVDREATVLEPGIKHEECSVCHEKRNENTEIPMLSCPHTGTLETTAAKDATCTEAGNSRYSYCSACQNYYSDDAGQHEIEKDSWIIAALDHDEVAHEAKAPTCTEIGWDAYVTCSRCDYTTYVEKAELGHDEVDHEAKEPTCTEIGWDAYVTCTRCDYTTYVEKAELGHDEVDHEAQAPTCTEIGWDAYVTCTRCDYTTYVEKAELGHDEVEYEAKAPTCTEVGWQAYVACSRCDYTTKVEDAELGHDEAENPAKDPTCTEPGWEAYITCTRCDYSTKVEIPAKGHGVLEEVAAVAATCQKEGNIAHWHCPDCEMNFSDAEGIDLLESVATPVEPDNHSWPETGEETKATCQAEGKIVYTCGNEGCDETKEDILPVDPEGHVWDEGVPFGIHSCNASSYIVYTCTLCGTENKVVDREQHFRIPIAEEIPATCTEDGMTSGWKCEKCDEFWIPQEVIPALGHDWNGSLPCQSDASACTRCGLHFDTKQDHLVVVDPEVPATCTETGLSEGSHCGYCDEILVAQTETPVTDHNWIVTDMEIPATCGATGHKEGASYCLDCNYDADPIPALEHSWMHRDAKKATYSAIGWTAHDYCLLCKAIKTVEQYEEHPCEFCGENPEGYVEIPKVEIQEIKTLDEFIANIGYLEMMAEQYAVEHPGADPLGLVLNYMRTAVENYTSGSWAIMAGPEDKDFLKFVQEAEDTINSKPSINVWVNVSGLKKIKSYKSPSNEANAYNGRDVECMSGHFFGTMDMTYHNKGSQNHADVGGWVGDLTDLLSTSDEHGVSADLTLEEKIAYIREKYLFKEEVAGSAGSFGSKDLYADLDGYYFMNELISKGYKTGDLAKMMREYYQPGLTLKQRVSYLLNNRLDALSTRNDLRTAVYNVYTSNKLISTLEGTRNFKASGTELADLRKAVCYAFADEMCRIAGDYVEDLTNPRFTVFDTETKILAPGISQMINYAKNAEGKQIVYYVATADIGREDVGMWVNYYDRDPGTPDNPIWKNNSVPSSAQNAQDRYGDPASEDYIKNFNVIVSTNAGGFDMSETATPGGLLVMNGIEWHPQTSTAGFFAILDDGSAYMGTAAEYAGMKSRIKEAIGGFGEFVVRDGQVTGSATANDAPRTSVGITSTGRVVVMCIDGRQYPFSSGASLQDVGYIMKEAGCVEAINLDGGGSTTFVARQPGSETLTVMNRPSDGYPRNVSTNLLLYSTAPSSTAFDHADIESAYDYATVNTPVQMTAVGVSPSGNAVEIPEGATWAVSDENWASITEDGVFTGKRQGDVKVYLMLGGEIVGSKLMTLTTPDQVYFEKAKVDVIYGSGAALPLRARVGGKDIAINPGDVSFTLSAPTAGVMEGFTFKAYESAVKTLSITAAVSENIKASINIMLYKQGENSFDFDKATGGDRMLAWDRQVSNSKVEDGTIYHVIDPSKEMVTSYTFALDMTSIPIPERLEELTYMLPGGTLEGANAWSFLLSLAQRISDLTWVKATIDIDDRFDVDYSNMKVLNDYFQLKETKFDETANTLTVTLNWIKQSQVIDEATANPLCLINGIKLTPKAGVWDDTDKINVSTSGTVSYEIYMRASGLYSFAQKPENQAVFGLYPYRNPADTTDAGGYFRDTYAQITDEYTLVNVLKEGWVNEDGGFAYYVEGERLTGIKEVEGYYYDFGEAGVNVGQTKFSGMFLDQPDENTEGVWRFVNMGLLTNGWQSINDEWYYFRNNAAVSGEQKIGGVKFNFESNGKLVSGVWVNTLNGVRYYYGPDYVKKYWYQIGEDWYYFVGGYRVTGYQRVGVQGNVHSDLRWRDFGDDGVYRGTVGTGIFQFDGVYYYLEEGAGIEKHLLKWNDEYYYSTYLGKLAVNKTLHTASTSCDLPTGQYTFGPDGKMIGSSRDGEIVNVDGVLYYYEAGKGVEKQLVCVDGDYYFSIYRGEVVTNKTINAWKTNCDMPKGTYTFGPDGKMLGSSPDGAVVEVDGVLYYYENGVGVEKALVKCGDDYYFSTYKGKLAIGKKIYAWGTNCDLPKGHYEFGADGKMLQGVLEKDGVLYYYENGVGVEKGLIKWNGDYYYSTYLGKLAVNKIVSTYQTNCDLPKGRYEFGADGKMLRGIIERDGVLYYYENGVGVEKGLVYYDGAYYYAAYQGKLAVGKSIKASLTSCDLPVGHYEFGIDGKMVQGIVEKDGILYYYENGVAAERGLIKYNGAYYYAAYQGKLAVSKTMKASLTSCDLPVGTYEFGADGKMLHGIVEKDGELYYYENGVGVEKGLIKYDGAYYFSTYKGKLAVGKTVYAWQTNCDLPKGQYEFDAEGKMIGASATGEIVVKDGVRYYYEKGVGVEKGLVYVDGYYYYATYQGKLVVNKTLRIPNGNGLLLETTYTFNELGQIIG